MYWLFKPAEAHGAWKPQSWRPLAPMLSYGGRATLYNLLNYASSKVDTVLVGHHAQTGSTGTIDNPAAAGNGWTTTGLYDRSAYLMSLPVSILGKLGDSVLFSGMSAIQNEKDALQSVLRRALGLIAWLTFPGSLALAWFAGDVAALLLGEPYAEAEPIVRVLFIGVAFRSMIKLADALIRAVDALNVAILIKSIYLAGLGLSSWFVLSVGWGIEGVAWSVTIWTVVQFLFLSAWALRSAEWNFLDAMRSVVPGIKSLLIAAALLGILSQVLHYAMDIYVPSASPLTIHLAHAVVAIISTIIALFAAAVVHPEVVDGGDLEFRKRWTAFLPLRLQNRIL